MTAPVTRVLLPVAGRRETLALAWRMLGSRRGVLALTVLTYVAAGLCGLVAPWLLGQVVDGVRADDADAVVVRAAVGIGTAALVGGVLSAAASWLLALACGPALALVRESVLDNALQLDASRLEEAGSGDLLSRVGDDVRSVADSLVDVVPLLVQSAVAVVLTVGGLLALDWRLGLAGLATAPFYLASLRWYLPLSVRSMRARGWRRASGPRPS